MECPHSSGYGRDLKGHRTQTRPRRRCAEILKQWFLSFEICSKNSWKNRLDPKNHDICPGNSENQPQLTAFSASGDPSVRGAAAMTGDERLPLQSCPTWFND
jgi:hypothetical protein